MKELRGFLERIGWGKKSDVANQPLDAETANQPPNPETLARNSEYFARLIAKYGNNQYKDGLPQRSMSLQDVVDVVGLYMLAAGGNIKELKTVECNLAECLVDGLVDFELVREEINGDLYHYPGGIIVKKKLGMSEYVFMCANRQQADEYKRHLEPLFRECGIPIQSNLPG